jgi:hypothetical protein
MHSGLNADLTNSLPVPSLGTLELRVQNTTEQPPVSSAGGAFRIVCDFVGYKYDDPIVHFAKPGVSHLHTFVCNASTDANSTAETLAAGKSAARGGVANRSAYWTTTLLDMRTMKPVPIDSWITYYKGGAFIQQKGYGWTGPDGVWHAAKTPWPGFTEIPNGLKIVAGDPMKMAPTTGGPLTARWKCDVPNVGGTMYSQTIPDCPAGTTLYQEIYFPQCWDGKNLDSPDHKAHMAYPINVRNEGDSRNWSHYECPVTHPVVVPHLSFNASWKITEAGQAKNYRLSADSDLALPAGLRSHADAFIMWDPAIKTSWHNECIVKSKDCHAHLIGGGRMLVGPP